MTRRDLDTNYIIKLYKSGKSCNAISEMVGCSRQAIITRLGRAGIEVRPRKCYGTTTREVDSKDILDLYNGGMSVKALSKKFSCSRDVIKNRLLKLGVVPRGRSESMYLRMAQSSPEEIAALTEAAHIAAKGRSCTFEERCKVAATREKLVIGASRTEEILRNWLESDGLTCCPQKAVGPYNIDIAVDEGRIAVEVFGGNWHCSGNHAGRFKERTEYLLDSGYFLVIVWVNLQHPLEVGAAKYIVSLSEKICRNEAVGGKYRVIWGNGERSPTGEEKFDYRSIVP